MDENTLLNFDYPTETPSIIKVIGVGGGGGNAVQRMYREGIHDVTFVVCNTDRQALFKNEVPVKLQLGKMGLGAGGKPLVAKEAAEQSVEDIKALLNDGTEMAFVTAGMGGGTGTGAGPVIAGIAKEMEILTVGIVTIPFVFESEYKILQALNGVEEMSKNVDALLVINNERLFDIYHGLSVFNCFAKADETLTIAAKSIAETITLPGYINLDFADVKTILKDGGVAIISTGIASGNNRIAKAINNALHSPLVNNNNAFDAKKILFNISSSESVPLIMDEMTEINDFMAKFKSKNIEVIWGVALDENLGENIKITILATGFGRQESVCLSEEEGKRTRKIIEMYYGPQQTDMILGGKTRPRPFIFTLEQLEDDSVIDAVINNPAYNRKFDFLKKEEFISNNPPIANGVTKSVINF
jgi:cell division protein FtsZ